MSSSSANKDSKRFSHSHDENTVRKTCTKDSEEICHAAWPYYCPPGPRQPPRSFLPLWLFLQITFSESFSLECTGGISCKWAPASPGLFRLCHLMGSMLGHSAEEKKCHQQLFKGPLPSKHDRRRWLQPTLSSNKTPKKSGAFRKQNFFLMQIQNIRKYKPRKKTDI